MKYPVALEQEFLVRDMHCYVRFKSGFAHSKDASNLSLGMIIRCFKHHSHFFVAIAMFYYLLQDWITVMHHLRERVEVT